MKLHKAVVTGSSVPLWWNDEYKNVYISKWNLQDSALVYGLLLPTISINNIDAILYNFVPDMKIGS